MERTGYASGTPSFSNLSTTDLQGSLHFYGALLGWEFEDQGEAMDHYTMATLRGKTIAGIAPARPENPHSFWSTYITVDDIDTSAKVAINAGATQMGEVMDLSPAGQMAVFQDPTGAMFCTWQPGLSIGAELVNEAGALAWNELYTRDTAAAATFYNNVFGWTGETKPLGALGDYTSFLLDGAPIGGMMNFPPNVPDQVPPYWLTYYACGTLDAKLEEANALGAHSMTEIMDVGVGIVAIIQDPQGAPVALIQLHG